MLSTSSYLATSLFLNSLNFSFFFSSVQLRYWQCFILARFHMVPLKINTQHTQYMSIVTVLTSGMHFHDVTWAATYTHKHMSIEMGQTCPTIIYFHSFSIFASAKQNPYLLYIKALIRILRIFIKKVLSIQDVLVPIFQSLTWVPTQPFGFHYSI